MLSVVSTPIGNLGDITLRALETLKACDAIVCEDTRVTGQLLKLLDLPKKELLSLHGYSKPGALDSLLRRLEAGQHLCLVSDAGTPGISDPGSILIGKAREAGIRDIAVVPGASAVLAALSLSGFPTHEFTYLGFLPLKKGRQTLLKTLPLEEKTIVFYESVHRILKTLAELGEVFSTQPEREIAICRELTKLHEEVIRCPFSALAERSKTLTTKGEFVLVIGPKR